MTGGVGLLKLSGWLVAGSLLFKPMKAVGITSIIAGSGILYKPVRYLGGPRLYHEFVLRLTLKRGGFEDSSDVLVSFASGEAQIGSNLRIVAIVGDCESAGYDGLAPASGAR